MWSVQPSAAQRTCSMSSSLALLARRAAMICEQPANRTCQQTAGRAGCSTSNKPRSTLQSAGASATHASAGPQSAASACSYRASCACLGKDGTQRLAGGVTLAVELGGQVCGRGCRQRGGQEAAIRHRLGCGWPTACKLTASPTTRLSSRPCHGRAWGVSTSHSKLRPPSAHRGRGRRWGACRRRGRGTDRPPP